MENDWFIIRVEGKNYKRSETGLMLEAPRPELLTNEEAKAEIKRLRAEGFKGGGTTTKMYEVVQLNAPVEPPPPIKIQEIDLRGCTRGAERTQSAIYLVEDTGERTPWFRFGEAQIQWGDRGTRHHVAARLTSGMADFEHDSAYAFQIPLVGLEMDRGLGVYGSQVEFTARIAMPSRWEELRVPMGPYDPAKLKGASQCDGGEYCKFGVPHLIVPEGHYAGPPATELTRRLHKQLAGKAIKIIIGLSPPETEE